MMILTESRTPASIKASTDVAMVPKATFGGILLLSRFLDGGIDIAVGFFVDRTNSKHGKARPWLLGMLIPGVLSMILLFYAPNFSDTEKSTPVSLECSYKFRRSDALAGTRQLSSHDDFSSIQRDRTCYATRNQTGIHG